MRLSRRASWFLTAFGVWSIWIWVTFFKNLWADGEGLAFVHGDHSRPTAYFWIHAALALSSLILGVVVGSIGVRSLRGMRRAVSQATEEQPERATEPVA
ncbi:SCO4848 family membrane protein [Streptacidiphilus sp. MAP5-3]|uniref:SCO4848 family membrane protein n=1 Tax=unclassified Streptacidiphilus TaxID=2643834 RepID=UPI0035136D71